MRDRYPIYILGTLLLLGFGSLAVFFWLNPWQNGDGASADSIFAASDASSSTPLSITAIPPTQPSNMRGYFSLTYHFSVYYPDDLTMIEHPGDYGSAVVLFQDAATEEGFQVFVVPYDEPKISEKRFKMDEPSGVMQSPQNITIDGAPATEFLSTNPAMGTAREIWFLHGGFLYEVTAPQALDAWLSRIMQTWQFVP